MYNEAAPRHLNFDPLCLEILKFNSWPYRLERGNNLGLGIGTGTWKQEGHEGQRRMVPNRQAVPAGAFLLGDS